MKLEEALEKSQYIHGAPIVRQCAICKEWLDEQSEVLVSTNRAELKALLEISHGYCDKCYNEIVF